MTSSSIKHAAQTGDALPNKSQPKGSVAFDAPAPAYSRFAQNEEFELLAPEEVILDASCAFDALARRAVMHNRSGLTKTQADIIMALALFGSMSMSELAQNLAVSKEHISRAVFALSEQGHVQKHRSEQNFRVVETELTAQGRELSNAIRADSLERLREPLATLADDEREELIALAARATELLCKVKFS